jgi:hypothetical protein
LGAAQFGLRRGAAVDGQGGFRLGNFAEGFDVLLDDAEFVVVGGRGAVPVDPFRDYLALGWQLILAWGKQDSLLG